MGHLPASERPRSCSLGTGPFVFRVFGNAFALRFTRHINGLRGYRAPTPIAAATIGSAPRSKSRHHAAQTTTRLSMSSPLRSVFVSLPAWLIDCFCCPAAKGGKPQQASRVEGPNFAGTGRFFSSKIATAAEKTPPIREETQMKSRTLTVLALAAGLFAAGQAFAQQQPRAGGPDCAARPECHSREDAVQHSLRRADHHGASARAG